MPREKLDFEHILINRMGEKRWTNFYVVKGMHFLELVCGIYMVGNYRWHRRMCFLVHRLVSSFTLTSSDSLNQVVIHDPYLEEHD